MPRELPSTVMISAGSGSTLHEGRVGSFEVRAFSARGLDHHGEELADDAALVHRVGKNLLVAVADGVGSLPRSRECALAVLDGLRSGLEVATGDSGDQLTQAVASSWRAAQRAVEVHGPGASTLVCALLMPDAERSVVVTATVGDSTAYVLSPEGHLQVLHSEVVVRSGTRALPHHDEPEIRRAVVDARAVVLLMSDGFEEGLVHRSGRVRERLAHRWLTPPSPHDFMTDAAFRGDYFYDDRTVVAVWRDQSGDGDR